MFEPENDIERALIRAAAEPAARPDFARALLDAEVFTVLVPERGPIVPDASGNTTIPAGTTLRLATAQRGKETLIPFFSAQSRARAWFAGDHIVAPDKTRDLFGRYRHAAFVLNPGSDYGKEFVPGEAERLLAGNFGDGLQEIVIDKPETVLLGYPKERPETLIAALAREFTMLKGLRGAWLMLATRQGQREQSWMLGVDHDGDWDDVRGAISRAVAGGVLQGRLLDAMRLDDSSLSSTLRTGIPVTASRNWFTKLFR